MKVTFSTQARDDLGEIAEWIARDNPERALSYNDELVDAGIALSDFPGAYPRWPHRSGREIRRLNHKDHAIIYEVLEAEVQILTIIHGARDLATLIDAI